MMIVSLLLPFLFLLLLFFLGRGVYRSGRFQSVSRSKWLLGGYIGLLLISLVTYYTIPADHLIYGSPKSQLSGDAGWKEWTRFLNDAQRGNPKENDWVRMKKSWTFRFRGQRLGVTDTNYATFFVERKTVDDQTIEARYYVSRTIVEGADLSAYLKAPQLSLSGPTLAIVRPKQSNLVYDRFVRDFTITQFFGGTDNQWQTSHGIFIGPKMIYLRIPKSVQIDNSNSVQWVDKVK